MATVKQILKEIDKCYTLKAKYEIQCDHIQKLLIKNFDFNIDEEYITKEEYFSIDYQPSDGFVLVDGDTTVYDLQGILNYIDKQGKVKSLDDLRDFSI